MKEDDESTLKGVEPRLPTAEKGSRECFDFIASLGCSSDFFSSDFFAAEVAVISAAAGIVVGCPKEFEVGA